MPASYLTEFKALKKQRNKDSDVYSLYKEFHSKWTVICSEEGNYYAIDNNDPINSGKAILRKAFQLDKQTGELDHTRPFMAKTIIKGSAESGHDEKTLLATLGFSEYSETSTGKAIVISHYHPGHTMFENTKHQADRYITQLDLKDRLALIVQISEQLKHLHRKGILHRDIKSSNVVIDTTSQSHSAWIIDLGSAIRLENTTSTYQTTLEGLSLIAVPIEAIQDAIHERRSDVLLNIITGELDTRSDIYAMAPVIAGLLGAANPYGKRGKISANIDGIINLDELFSEISGGFLFDDVLIGCDKKVATAFEFFRPEEGSHAAFSKKHTKRAPNDPAILDDETIKARSFVLYQNQFLFVDKNKGKVDGRSNQKPLDFQKKMKDSSIASIESTLQLSERDQQQCSIMTPDATGNGTFIPASRLLFPSIQDFVHQMGSNNREQRPSSEEVHCFFKIAHDFAELSAKPSELNIEAPHTMVAYQQQKNQILRFYIQLQLILHKLWETPLRVDGLPYENTKGLIGHFSEYNFSMLMPESHSQDFQIFGDLIQLNTAHQGSTQALQIVKENLRSLEVLSPMKKLAFTMVQKAIKHHHRENLTVNDIEQHLQDKENLQYLGYYLIMSRLLIQRQELILAPAPTLMDLCCAAEEAGTSVSNQPHAAHKTILETGEAHCQWFIELPPEIIQFSSNSFPDLFPPETNASSSHSFTLDTVIFWIDNSDIVRERLPEFDSAIRETWTPEKIHTLITLREDHPVMLEQLTSDRVARPTEHSDLLSLLKDLTLQSRNIAEIGFGLEEKAYRLQESIKGQLIEPLKNYKDTRNNSNSKALFPYRIFGYFSKEIKMEVVEELMLAIRNNEVPAFLQSIDTNQEAGDALYHGKLGKISSPLLQAMKASYPVETSTATPAA